MRQRLMDLRHLHLAKGLEEMFEGLEKAFERHLPGGVVRDALRPIFQEGPYHRKLQEAYKTLNTRLAAEAGTIPARDLLECILACERTAQRFYADHAKDLADPALAEVFRGLANEEASHIKCVEYALSLQP